MPREKDNVIAFISLQKCI